MNEEVQTPVTQTDDKTEDTTVTQTGEEVEVKDTERMLSQSKVNELLKEERIKLESKYKGYDTWLESQKTEAQKQTELTQDVANTKTENEKLKQKLLISDAEVGKEFRGYVHFTVSEMDGDFGKNLKQFLKDNPKYLNESNSAETSRTTGLPANKITTGADDGVTALLKKKHPDITF